MNFLDENFPDDQRQMLIRWRVPHRQVGRGTVRLGAQDSDIIPALHRLSGVTFFTLDKDFFKRELCHGSYCLAWLDVRADDAAEYLRRFLHHPRFTTCRQRVGAVVRIHHDGVDCWERNRASRRRVVWPED